MNLKLTFELVVTVPQEKKQDVRETLEALGYLVDNEYELELSNEEEV